MLLQKGHYYRAALGLTGMELLLGKGAIPDTLEGLGFEDVQFFTDKEDLDDAFLYPDAMGAPLVSVSGATAWVAAQYTANDADHAIPPQVLEWRDHGLDDKDRPRAPPKTKPGSKPTTPPVTPGKPPVVTPVDPSDPPPSPPVKVPPKASGPTKTATTKDDGSKRAVLVLGGVVVVALIAVAGIAWWMHRKPKRNPSRRRAKGKKGTLRLVKGARAA